MFSVDYVISIMRQRILILVILVLVLEQDLVDSTTGQLLQNLLRHPHYADGHQHSAQHHSQHPTSHSYRHLNGSGAPSIPHYSTGSTSWGRAPAEAPTLPTGTWSRVGTSTSKDYYRMSGYSSLKATSAAKSNAIVDHRIPQELSDVREANDHFVRMRSGAFCRWPRPQAVCVKDLYPEKEFLPRCTLLHRCTETAGCCEEEGYQCGPKAMQEVVLHFYVLGGDHMSSDVEKLFFVNHTECECKPKPSPKPTIASSTTNAPTSPVPSYYYPQRDQQNPKCRPCPTPFCVREHEDGRCSCDCFDRHKPCIRIKRGREPLADIERRCVLSGQCNIPDCEYGSYDPEKARCPKRPDHLGPREGEYVKRPLPNHKNPNHRWLYFERD